MEKYEIQIKNELNELSDTQKLLFGACCVDRILYVIDDFDKLLSDVYDEDNDPSYFSSCSQYLDAIFRYIENNIQISQKDIQRILENLDEIIPDTEEFSDDTALFTQNTMIALSYLYNFLDTNKLNYIINCSNKLIETVDVVSYESNSENIESIYEAEYKVQLECISMIKNNSNVTALRNFNKNNIISTS